MREEILDAALDLAVTPVCAEFGEKEDLPRGGLVFGPIPDARFAPPALRVLGGKNLLHQLTAHDGSSRSLHLAIVLGPIEQMSEGEITDWRTFVPHQPFAFFVH